MPQEYLSEKSFLGLFSAAKDDRSQWSPWRQKAARILQGQKFDAVIGCLILFNVGLMIAEADQNAACGGNGCAGDTWITTVNLMLLVVYTCETIAKLATFRCGFMLSGWNQLDVCIVGVGWIDFGLAKAEMGSQIPNLNMLRVLRVIRLARAAKLLKFLPELYVMIRGFFIAMKVMLYGFIMIMVLLIIWALLAVEIVHPLTLELDDEAFMEHQWCPHAFESVWNATILFFQTLVAGDAWGTCAVPIIRQSPLTFFLFAGSLTCVSLGFTNLILAVIVDTAASARELDAEEQLALKLKEQADGIRRWETLIKRVDSDNNGSISKEELLQGYDSVEEIKQTLQMIDINREDIELLFKLMANGADPDALSYDEFITAIQRAQSQDLRMYLMLTRLEISNISRRMDYQDRCLELLSEALRIRPSRTMRPGEELNGGSSRWSSSPSLPAEPQTQVVKDSSALRSEHEFGSSGLEAKEALNGFPASKAASLDDELRAMKQSIERQFQDIAASIKLNTVTLQRHTDVLEEVMTAKPGQPTLNSITPDTTADMGRPKAERSTGVAGLLEKVRGSSSGQRNSGQPAAATVDTSSGAAGVPASRARGPDEREATTRSAANEL